MCVRRNVLLFVACLAISLFGVNQPAKGGDCGYGCGSLPVPSCYAPPAAVHNHYHCCNGQSYGHCCQGRERRDRDRGAERAAEANYRSSAPVPIVSSMPVFSMPMMMASVPVMPTTVSRAAEPRRTSERDCHERIDRLEDNVYQLAESVRKLQLLVYDQSRILEKITEKLEPKSNPTSE